MVTRVMFWYKCAVIMPFHPIEVCTLIKRKRNEISFLLVLILMTLAVAVRLFSIYTVNYTVASSLPEEANALLEVAIILAPVLLWSAANYALMTVIGGESTFKETLTIAAYSLIPYIVGTPVLILLSFTLSNKEAAFFGVLQTVIWIWCGLLIFVGFKESNNLSFAKSVLFAVLIIVVMALMVAVGLLMFSLIGQIIFFVQEIGSELKFFLR